LLLFYSFILERGLPGHQSSESSKLSIIRNTAGKKIDHVLSFQLLVTILKYHEAG